MNNRKPLTKLIAILVTALLASGLLAIARDVVTALAAVSWN